MTCYKRHRISRFPSASLQTFNRSRRRAKRRDRFSRSCRCCFNFWHSFMSTRRLQTKTQKAKEAPKEPNLQPSSDRGNAHSEWTHALACHQYCVHAWFVDLMHRSPKSESEPKEANPRKQAKTTPPTRTEARTTTNHQTQRPYADRSPHHHQPPNRKTKARAAPPSLHQIADTRLEIASHASSVKKACSLSLWYTCDTKYVLQHKCGNACMVTEDRELTN